MHPDQDDLVRVEWILAENEFRSGNFDEARKRAERILAHYQEMGDRHSVVTIQSVIAHSLRKIGNFEEALTNYRTTIKSWQWEGHRGAVAHELECFAFIAGAWGQNERAARLLGAAEALRELIGSPMTPAERGEYDQAVSSVRTQMDETAFNTAWAEGRAMTMEQAIALALEE